MNLTLLDVCELIILLDKSILGTSVHYYSYLLFVVCWFFPLWDKLIFTPYKFFVEHKGNM